MNITNNTKKPNMDCINLLTSILIYYPEISKIAIAPDEKIYLTYITKKILPKETQENLQNLLNESLQSYHYLTGLDIDCNEINIYNEEQTSFIYLIRDIKSFSHGELHLINELIREQLKNNLIIDLGKIPTIDTSLLSQAEVIDTMMASLKINPVQEKMIGIREAGRVIVFNK